MANPANRHADEVFSVAEGRSMPSADRFIVRSWQRSANTYKLDPASKRSPLIITESELRKYQDAASRLIAVARYEIDHLYVSLRSVNYVVLLCDTDGTVIDCRGDLRQAAQYTYWGVWLGGVWSEDVEGTNGIGTVITERRPLTVHMSEHFRNRHITLSCSGAPIFDGAGEFAGVLDVSSIDPELSQHAHALTGGLVTAAARAIEERLFRERHRRDWIIAVRVPDDLGSAMLIAVDRDWRIVGADRVGRSVLSRWGFRIDGALDLRTVFERTGAALPRRNQNDVWIRLKLPKAEEILPAIVTSPDDSAARWLQSEGEDLQTRPRLDALVNGRFAPSPLLVRGGLPPAILRRVREYVDSNLEQNLDIDSLATTAGLSPFHFARAFKQSEGRTPHHFILQRRIAKARELLSRGDLPLSEIALIVGFADQSHFTRRFQEIVGISPGKFRRLQG
jgi:transcriptional regulator of acetoin/glycerol metabolism/AraC-like DNA-binding protein